MLTQYQKTILDRLSEMGHPEYWEQVNAHHATANEVLAEAGPHGRECPFTIQAVRNANHFAEMVAQDAVDRYEDWASD